MSQDSDRRDAENAELAELGEQLQSELRERDAAMSATARQMEMCEALNRELDQAVADLQVDLAASKNREEAHQATLSSLNRELQTREGAVQEWKAQAQQWQIRASQLEAELDAQVRTLQDSVRQVTDSAGEIQKLGCC